MTRSPTQQSESGHASWEMGERHEETSPKEGTETPINGHGRTPTALAMGKTQIKAPESSRLTPVTAARAKHRGGLSAGQVAGKLGLSRHSYSG